METPTTEVIPHEPQPEKPSEPVHGPLYYLCRNLGRLIWSNRITKKIVVGAPPVLCTFIYFASALSNPIMVEIRKRSPAIVTALMSFAVVLALHTWAARWHRVRRLITGSIMIFWLAVMLSPDSFFHNLSLYGAYLEMDRHELTRLPLTQHERIYPLSMVTHIVHDRLTQSHFTVSPFETYVDPNERLWWIAQKTPAGLVNTVSLQDVSGLVQVATSSTTVDIQHHAVDFKYGRDLFILRDLGHYVLPHKLSFLDIFDKELDRDDITYVKDAQGRWVMVMAVIDWDGIWPFCVPRFGGVFVCPQRDQGEIRLYAPDEIAKTPWLRSQNLVPELITTFYAESWKFNQGFGGWIRNQGVTKITKIPEDTAQQPFTLYMKDVGGHDGLFHFFALEPAGRSAGLSKILLFDASGSTASPAAYVYDLEARGEELVGPARIAETIKASDIHVNWKEKSGYGSFIIAESRPLIRDHDGKRLFHWFNSVITEQQGSGQPRVVLADPKSLAVEWLEPAAVQKLVDE